jgi:hypothetical protein
MIPALAFRLLAIATLAALGPPLQAEAGDPLLQKRQRLVIGNDTRTRTNDIITVTSGELSVDLTDGRLVVDDDVFRGYLHDATPENNVSFRFVAVIHRFRSATQSGVVPGLKPFLAATDPDRLDAGVIYGSLRNAPTSGLYLQTKINNTYTMIGQSAFVPELGREYHILLAAENLGTSTAVRFEVDGKALAYTNVNLPVGKLVPGIRVDDAEVSIRSISVNRWK